MVTTIAVLPVKSAGKKWAQSPGTNSLQSSRHRLQAVMNRESSSKPEVTGTQPDIESKRVELFLKIPGVRVVEEGTYRLWGDMGWDTEESAR